MMQANLPGKVILVVRNSVISKTMTILPPDAIQIQQLIKDVYYTIQKLIDQLSLYELASLEIQKMVHFYFVHSDQYVINFN